MGSGCTDGSCVPVWGCLFQDKGQQILFQMWELTTHSKASIGITQESEDQAPKLNTWDLPSPSPTTLWGSYDISAFPFTL